MSEEGRRELILPSRIRARRLRPALSAAIYTGKVFVILTWKAQHLNPDGSVIYRLDTRGIEPLRPCRIDFEALPDWEDLLCQLALKKRKAASTQRAPRVASKGEG